MKKRRAFSASALLPCLIAALALSSCASLGVSSKGAEYFVGKKEKALAKYFGYEGEVLAEGGEDFDKAVFFSNKSIVAYMDWSNTTYTKSRRYSAISDFEFIQMSDGCHLFPNGDHYFIEYVNSVGGRSNVRSNVEHSGYDVYVISTHNNTNQFKALINTFNNNIRSYGAVSSEYDNAHFDAGNVGDEYYIYSIESYSLNYQGEPATRYRYKFERVDIYMDEQTQRDTQVAYYYSIPNNEYYAPDRRTAISKDEALANVSGYESRGYTLREVNGGLALVAFIKDGVVAGVYESFDKDSDFLPAAMVNSFGWVNELLVFGANPNTQDENGITVLGWATINGNAEIARLLLDAGANPNIQDVEGVTSLMLAAYGRNARIVRQLLEAKANPNIQDMEGITALMLAAGNEDAEIVRLLLDAGANPAIRNNDGSTALDYAEDAEIIRMLSQ